MADTRKIIIELRDKDSSSYGASKEPLKSAAQKILKLEEKKKTEKEKIAIMLGYYAFGNAKSLISNGISLSFNRYTKMTENYLFENGVQDVKTIVGKGTSLATSIYAGAKVGTLVTPGVGTAVGAVIGVGAYALGETLSYSGKLSGYYSTLNATNLQTEWGARRAGLYNNGRGTEN